jgi:DNA-binding SARP family transcriptional activator
MALSTLIDQSLQAFQEQAGQARLILLHPRSRYRSALVAQLMNLPGLKVFYHALGPDDLNLESFVSNITHDLANQHPTFGRHLNLLPSSAYRDLNVLLETFALDLSELSDEDFLLILDEYDRADSADDIQLFIAQLIGKLPSNCRLVLNGRTLPRLPFVSLIAQKYAILLEDERLIKSNFYEMEDRGKTKLDVFALGQGHVLMNGAEINTWEGHLPRLLFFFALDRPIVTRSEICKAFWPELEMEQAVNVFHVTKRRLHKALDVDVLVHEDTHYCINPDFAVRYDVMELATALLEARNETASKKRLAALQRAIDLYRGPFLQGHTDRWILDRRNEFRAGYFEALTEMAHIRLAEERYEHALGLFQRALAEDFTRENIHRDIMQLYAKLGRRSEAAAHYQRLVEEQKKSGRSLEPETEAVHRDIMS